MRAANLGDPRPRGPVPFDGVVQRPQAGAERGVDDHEQEEHEGVDDPRPDVRRTGAVRPPEPLGHGPDYQAQENPARVCDLPHEAEEECEGYRHLQESDHRREEGGVRTHRLAPEAEPRLKPSGLALAGVGDHLGQRVRDSGLEFQGSVDVPNDAEDHPDRGLQRSHVPYEPVVQVHLDGSHRGASRNSTCSTIPGVGTYTVQLKPASGRPPSFPVADRSQPGLRAAHRARIDTAAAIWDWGNYSQKYVLAAKYG